MLAAPVAGSIGGSLGGGLGTALGGALGLPLLAVPGIGLLGGGSFSPSAFISQTLTPQALANMTPQQQQYILQTYGNILSPTASSFLQQTGGGTGTTQGGTFWPPIFQDPLTLYSDLAKIIGGVAGGVNSGIGGSGGTSGTTGTGTGTTGTSGSQLGGTILSQLGGLLGPLGGLYGALQAQRQQNWNNAAKISTLNYLQRLGANAEQQQSSSQAAYLPQMEQYMNTLMGMATPAQQQTLQGIQSALQSAPGDFSSVTPLSRVPGMQDMVNWLGGLQGQGAYSLGNLQNTLTNGPLNAGQQIASGLGTPGNPFSQQLSQLSSILTGGNPYIDQAQGVASGIIGQNPLLPMSQVISMAQNQSATQAHNAMNALRRQELNRTGVTGPAIASGSQDELLGSLQDQAMQNMSSAVTNAMMGQQGLQEQLFGQGANLFGSGQNAYLNQMLGGAGLINSNVQNLLGGLGSLGNLAGAQTGQYNALANLLGGMGNLTLGEGNMLQGVQNFGLNQNQQLYNTLGNLLGLQGNNANQLMSGSFQAAGFPQNVYNQNTGFLQNLASNNVGLFGNPAPVTSNSNLFNFFNPIGASGGRG